MCEREREREIKIRKHTKGQKEGERKCERENYGNISLPPLNVS